MKRHTISFKHAWNGIVISCSTQPNFVVHLILSFIALFLSYLLTITLFEWLIVLLLIGTGLSMELVNTAIEFTVDLITKDFHELAKFAKDTAAAAMLIHAITSLIIASVIFLPKLFVLVTSYNPWIL